MENPKEICEKFLSLGTKRDVAAFLGVKYGQIFYRVHFVPAKNYNSFILTQKSGKRRQILAPVSILKYCQQKLNFVLQEIYKPKAPVHGFTKDRSIVSNAKIHVRKRYVLNIDLEDFFPSINFGRVRGIFQAYPFNFNDEIATFLAQICCFRNQLPQGAPTSPIISNFICAKLDNEIIRLARQCKCHYTRYADDLTFSTSLKEFPEKLLEIGKGESGERFIVGKELRAIIEKNGFKINEHKVTFKRKFQCQSVTGLTVNEFPNVNRKFIRKIRAMLHAWAKHGYEEAEVEHFTKYYSNKHRNPDSGPVSFKQIVAGKINFLKMVRGDDDRIYGAFRKKFAKLTPRCPIKIEYDEESELPLVITEGKTDAHYLKAALNRRIWKGKIEIYEGQDGQTVGDVNLLKFCVARSTTNGKRPIICIFDRDNPDTLRALLEKGKEIQAWGRNVFSFAIPIPAHRKSGQGLSTEHYFTDDEIMTKTEDGKRLYLCREFHHKSKNHLTDPELSCTKLNTNPLAIIDCEVFNRDHKDVALRKSEFAKNVLDRKKDFGKFDFSHFSLIFENIDKIILLAKKTLK